MKTLVREEWLSVRREYNLHITPEFIQDINDFLHNNYDFVDDAQFEITEQDIVDAWYGEHYNDLYQGILNSVWAKGWKNNNYSFIQPIELGDLLHDVLSDEMWDQDYAEDNFYTEDFQDSVLDDSDEA